MPLNHHYISFTNEYFMKKILLLSFLLVSLTAFSQTKPTIKWLTFEEAVEQVKKEPKKVFIDVYTDWCGWCKKMDATTFVDPVIAKYMSQNFYAVKFDAERSDTLIFMEKTFVNRNPGKSRSSHELAQALLQGKMSYPSYVVMDESMRIISVVPGYFPAKDFEPVLHFFGENAYQQSDWTTFSKSFKGNVKE